MREAARARKHSLVALVQAVWPWTLSVALVVACAPAVPRDVVAQPTQVDPRAVVGTWRIEASPDGELLGASASFDAGSFVVEDDCFRAGGQWRASWSGAFLARSVDAQTACDVPAQPHTEAIPWLDTITAVIVGADDMTFLDAGRSAVARLSRIAHEPTDSGLLITKVSAVQAGDLDQYARPAPELPDRLDPKADFTTGDWVPDLPTDPVARPSLDFQANGMWYARYDCNGKGGPWALTGEGTFLALVRPDGAEGEACPTPGFLTALQAAAQAGVDRDSGKLLFLDSDGQVLQSFRRPNSDDRRRPS